MSKKQESTEERFFRLLTESDTIGIAIMGYLSVFRGTIKDLLEQMENKEETLEIRGLKDDQERLGELIEILINMYYK